MFMGFLKTVYIFYRLAVYYFRSLNGKNKIYILKQQFAFEALNILGFKLNILGRSILKNKLILVGNHISYLDILVVLAANPESVFLAKFEVRTWPIIGAVAHKIGTIFVKRDSKNSRDHIKLQIENTLKSNLGTLQIAGFPSGTTTLSEKIIWKKGLFEIAQNTNVHIQPFRISYSHQRECAYIDNDQLFRSLMNLFELKSKSINFEWGESFLVTDPIMQSESTRAWTQQIDLPQFESFKPG